MDDTKDDTKKEFIKYAKKIKDEMDLLFEHFYKIKHSSLLTGTKVWRPPIDVFETENEVIILVEIGGMKQKDFNIALHGNTLTIHGDRPEKIETRKCYHHMELNYGRFERNINLPEDINREKIAANYKEGFLEIKIEKKPSKKGKAKEIKIE